MIPSHLGSMNSLHRKVFIGFIVSIGTVNSMTTVQVDEETKKHLFSISAKLQSRRGQKTSLDDAIKYLISAHRAEKRDISRMLSLFGCLPHPQEARTLLRELRAGEERRLEELERKHRA